MFERKSIHPLLVLMGPEERFPLPQQLFHVILLCAAFVASVLFVSDLSLQLGSHYYRLTLGLGICFSILYGFSRKGGNFGLASALFFVVCLGAIGYGWVILVYCPVIYFTYSAG
jgi:hypothetical protein